MRPLSLLLRYRPWKPRHVALVVGDLLGRRRRATRTPEQHLDAALSWLCRAQDARAAHHDAGGVSAGWTFADGWLPSYPETSGYIVETFLAAARFLERPELRERVQRILDWELSVQNEDGSFPGHFNEPGAQPVIFNTGQILHGLVAGWQVLGRDDCREAALAAGRWLAEVMDEDGCWRRHTFQGIPHTYNTRTAWALARCGRATGDQDLASAARTNVEWALTQQDANGWFRSNAFRTEGDPFTHNIAYAIRGVLETGLVLEVEAFLAAAERAADAMAAQQQGDGGLGGTYDATWSPTASACCVTGLAQMSLIWMQLAAVRGRDDLRAAALRANRFLERTQRIEGRGGPEDGGIPGSAPLWGSYERFMFPNWAAKFFADALIAELHGEVVPAPET